MGSGATKNTAEVRSEFYSSEELEDLKLLGLSSKEVNTFVDIFKTFCPDQQTHMISIHNFNLRLGLQTNLVSNHIYDIIGSNQSLNMRFFTVSIFSNSVVFCCLYCAYPIIVVCIVHMAVFEHDN